jgi:hypothetical protein
VGGFNSWRKRQASLYFFDVKTDPAKPRYIKCIRPTCGAIADDFVRLPNGGFLISLMGNTTGEYIPISGLCCCLMRLTLLSLANKSSLQTAPEAVRCVFVSLSSIWLGHVRPELTRGLS